MGGSSSKVKQDEDKQNLKSFGERIKATVQDEVYRNIAIQREVQMAINIAKARDTIQIFGSAWLTLVSGVSLAKVMGRQVPPIVGVPIVVGGLALGNMADMAYGNKLQRVCREAEYILDYEKERFVPFPQAPFSHVYTDEQKAKMYDQATPVGDLFPSSFWARK